MQRLVRKDRARTELPPQRECQRGGVCDEYANLEVQPSPATPAIDRVQRQNTAEGAEGVAGDDIEILELAPEFGDVNADPSCPQAPKNLGNVTPSPPCPTDELTIDGNLVHFCVGSDAITNNELLSLRSLAREQRAGTRFLVHGYASTDGSPQGNRNLSCHRATRVYRELVNAGVPTQDIAIAAKGPTSRFGRSGADNRVAVVHTTEIEESRPDAPDAASTPQQILEAAVARLVARDYRLAADAYLSHWTCGRMPSIAEMVRRATVRIQGDPRATGANPANRMGMPSGLGRNEIVLSGSTFTEPENPYDCVTARIIDMVSHHFFADELSGGNINAPDVHAAALFLVELAGFAPCVTAAQTLNGIVVTPRTQWWPRPSNDPMTGRHPGCAGAPLPGATTNTAIPAQPTFTLDRLDPAPGEGPATAIVDTAQNIIRVTAPPGAFAFRAEAHASGDASQITHYHLGMLQTIVADEWLIEYVDGKTVQLNLPVPIRDGPPRRLDAPPWYMPPAIARFSAGANTRTSMSDSPSMSMAYEFIDFDLRGRVSPAQLRERNNVVNRAQARTTFHTWAAARRDDAPLDRASTHFLGGHEVRWNLDVDVVGETATATYSARIGGAPNNSNPMQLSGPTPAEITPRLRITEVKPPTPRAEAEDAVDLQTFRAHVRQVAEDLRPLRQALGIDGSVMVRVRLSPETGRLAVDRPDRPTVTIEERDEDRASPAAERQLAREFLNRLRKDLVLGPIEFRDPAQGGVPTFLQPLPSKARRERLNPDPFSAERGVGVIVHIREAQERERSRQELERHPTVYDPAFFPDVQVVPQAESYLYNFGVSGVDISQVCQDNTMHTDGCVKTQSPDFTPRIDVDFRPQTLGGDAYNSPVAVRVASFPVIFTLFTPRESPGGSTLNHELHHIVDHHDLLASYKDRLARAIRARVMEARQLAAETPSLRNQILSQLTIEEIVRQEEQPFSAHIRGELERRARDLHRRENERGLPPVVLPPNWRRPDVRPGAVGSMFP